MIEALELSKWMKQSQGFHLTVEDWKKWPIGEKRVFISFEFCYEEHFIEKQTKPGEVYDPVYFFKGNKIEITKKSDISWIFTVDGKYPQNINIETSHKDNFWKWMSLTRAHLKMYTRGRKFDKTSSEFDKIVEANKKLVEDDGKNKDYNIVDFLKKLPNKTRIGFLGGPLMDCKFLKKMPHVYRD